MKYFFPIHLDGGNRGCEAIAKSSAILLNKSKKDIIGLCRNTKLDKKLAIDRYVTLYNIHSLMTKLYICIAKFTMFFVKEDSNRQKIWFTCNYKTFLNKIKRSDVLVSTGGDMLCYGNNEVIYTNNAVKSKGVKTILWGCSIGKHNLTPEKIETLRKFDLIYSRESITTSLLKNELSINNVVTLPDSAFILEPEIVDVRNLFGHRDVVGINISNFVLRGFNLNSDLGQDLIKLIDYIVNTTEKNVLLIPHVLWKDQDDRVLSQLIFNKFEKTNRVNVLNSEIYNYCQIRYIISQCHIFIGARTHAVISAYSMCIPTIALGYSVKSQGIAKDLSMPIETVVNSEDYKNGMLLSAYNYLELHYQEILTILEKEIPSYRKSTYKIRYYVNYFLK